MKKIIRVIASLLAICILTVALLGLVSNMVSRKDSISKNAAFFENKGQHDILFFGSSHMLNAAFPMELWDDYGYTSYSFAGHGSRIPTSYWIMRNALEYEKPELVVIDCYYLSADIMADETAEFIHYTFDAFPLTTTKMQAVNEMFETTEDRMAFLFPFSTYHNRWKEINASSFLNEASQEKGASIREGYGAVAEPNYLPPEDRFAGESLGVIYLNKMIEHCQQNDIDVILTYIPFEMADWALREANGVAEIAQKYNVRYVGLRELSEQINFKTDFADLGHLNYSGGVKVTNYIGSIISDHYDIVDRRTDADYENWYADAEKYKAYKVELLKQQTSAAHFLPMLADDHLMSLVLCDGQWEYGAADAILADWGVSDDVLAGNETFLAFVDRENDICRVIFAGESLETSYGSLSLQNVDGNYVVTIDGENVYTLLSGDDIAMWARILDTDTGDVIYETLFNKKGYH